MRFGWRARRVALAAALALVATFPAQTRLGRAQGTAPWRVLLTSPKVEHPRGLAIDARGPASTPKWMYTADTNTREIVKFGTGGTVLKRWFYTTALQYRARVSLAVDARGNVWVADGGTGRISKYTSEGRLLARWGGFPGLSAIAIDRQGNVDVAQFAARRVTKLSPGGRVQRRWNVARLWRGKSAGFPTGIAFTTGGRMMISTTCDQAFNCAGAIRALGLGHDWVDVLLAIPPIRTQPPIDPGRVGIPHSQLGTVLGPRDQCNHRFVTLQSLATDTRGQLYVAGLLWPREDVAPAMAVAVGPGDPGCTHDGIGPAWTRWPLPGSDAVNGLAVAPDGELFVIQGDTVYTLRQ